MSETSFVPLTTTQSVRTKMLNAIMSPQKRSATAVSDFRLTNSPISFLFIVSSISGINGRGIRKLRTT